MGILYSEVHYDQLITDIENCCLTESVCTTCDKPSCIVGYAQNCIMESMKNKVTYIEGGDTAIPFTDFKLYEREDFVQGIAHTLKMCRSCHHNHYAQCIISVIRNCYEIVLFGEAQPYNGSNLRYLNYLHTHHPELAEWIITEFHNITYGNESGEKK